jgi:chemotaxis-related protein WspD
LQLCVSLANLLGLPPSDDLRPSQQSGDSRQLLIYPRMVVVQLGSERWVFPVDDIYGMERFAIDTIQPAPANVTQLNHSLTQGVIQWQGNFVSYLDDERLRYSLQRRALK